MSRAVFFNGSTVLTAFKIQQLLLKGFLSNFALNFSEAGFSAESLPSVTRA
jgi:hypothetical protein